MNGSTPAHEAHDHYLVAAFAAGDLDAHLRTDAERLVASCGDCSALLEDLRSIAAATAALPPVRRTRDFRLTAQDAARLRPVGWRRILEALGGARASFSRPLAVGLTTIGLAGLLVATIPGALGGALGGPSSAALDRSGAGNPVPYAAGAASAAPGSIETDLQAVPSPAPAATGGPKTGGDTSAASSAAASLAIVGPVAASASPAHDGGGPGSKDPQDKGVGSSSQGGAPRESAASGPPSSGGSGDTGGGPSPLLIGSLVCLLLGLGLLGVRWGARQALGR